MRNELSIAEDGYRDVSAIAGAINTRYAGDAFRRVIYTESHDEVANGKMRLTSEIDSADPGGYYARKRSLLGASLVLSSPGVPMLFQGQEFLENEWFRDEVPLDWRKYEQFAGIYRAYKDLIALRKNSAGTSAGLQGQQCDVYHQNPESKVVAFLRSQDSAAGTVLVVANLSVKPFEKYVIGAPAAGTWRVLINTDAKVYSDDFGGLQVPEVVEALASGADGKEFSLELPIGPYATIILSQY
jgi:1,4-alpha-glucan branching enzyme